MRAIFKNMKGITLLLTVLIVAASKAEKNLALDNLDIDLYKQDESQLKSLLECLDDESKCNEDEEQIRSRMEDLEKNTCSDGTANEKRNLRILAHITFVKVPDYVTKIKEFFNKSGKLNQFLESLKGDDLAEIKDTFFDQSFV